MKNKNNSGEKSCLKRKLIHDVNELLAMNNVIYVYGRKYMMMEGCKKIIKCDHDEIILRNDLEVKIHGTSLALRQLGNNTMGVEGTITSVEFIK
ncbi:MAG: hypothetical protein E7665_03510 [Ruminococcaceae bacterium]|nr:hypothetical protein [Oscillospiraceae bacterium]